MGFDYVDANGDGAVSAAEVEAMMEKHGPPEGAFIKLVMRSTDDDWPELTKEQADEIEAWVNDQLANGGTITK